MAHPIAIVGALGVVASAGAAVWYFVFREDDAPLDLPDDDDQGGDDSPDDKSSDDQGERPNVNGVAVCERTGTPYNAAKFNSPAQVSAYMIALGYPTGPTLKTASDKAQIIRFQKRAKVLKLRGAGSTHGQMSPCTLVSLDHALEIQGTGKWQPGA